MVWFGLMVQTAGDVLIASTTLLRATPVAFAPFARASLRYSAFVVLFASAWGGLALLLQGASWKFMLALLLLFFAYALLRMSLTLRFRAAVEMARLYGSIPYTSVIRWKVASGVRHA